MDGITFLYVKRNGLFFVLTTKFNVSPSLSIELLDRCTKVFKVCWSCWGAHTPTRAPPVTMCAYTHERQTCALADAPF